MYVHIYQLAQKIDKSPKKEHFHQTHNVKIHTSTPYDMIQFRPKPCESKSSALKIFCTI